MYKLLLIILFIIPFFGYSQEYKFTRGDTIGYSYIIEADSSYFNSLGKVMETKINIYFNEFTVNMNAEDIYDARNYSHKIAAAKEKQEYIEMKKYLYYKPIIFKRKY